MALPSSGAITLAQIQTEFGGADPISLSEYYKGGAYVSASDAAPNVPASGAISMSNFHGAAKNVVGQIEYTTPGTYSWTCPSGVTSVCVVAVGGGDTSSAPNGGAGGGLGWKNSIAVTPGNSYTVVVGGAGQVSYFISTGTVAGYGATGQTTPGSYVGDGGGSGGSNAGYGTGGGAGGYTGAGGQGNSAVDGGSGAGGGGGGSTARWGGSAGGGGVGLLGQGPNGAGGVNGSINGKGGSAGADGSIAAGTGGAYGGGGVNGAAGGAGALRIIWGSGRSFPSTNTGNL